MAVSQSKQPEADLNGDILPSEYYSGSFKDGWKANFRYWSDGTRYKLISYGEDKAIGGQGEFEKDLVYSGGNFTE